MKYLKSLLLILLLMFFLPNLTNAQLIQIGAGGGLTQILAPSYYTNSVGDGGLGFTTEWNAGAIFKDRFTSSTNYTQSLFFISFTYRKR